MRIIFKILRYTLYTLLVLLLVTVGAAGVLTLTEGGRATLASYISDAASGPDRRVEISGLQGIWSGELRVRQVLVSDREGPWLALRGVEVDWSPTALLGFAFDASRVHADRIEVARAPLAGEPSEGGGSFSLPVTVDVDEISLPDIALGESLAGAVARLSANGALTIDAEPIRVDATLALARTDGREGTLDAVLAYLPDDNRIDIRIDGAEPAGGVIANLLALPGTPAVTISVDGSGPASDWSGHGTFAIDGETVTTIDARHQTTGDGARRIEARGEGLFQPFLPDALKPLLEGSTRFDLAGTLAGQAVAIERAQINSDALSASASGRFDREGMTDLTIRADAAGEPISLSFGEGAARAEATLSEAHVHLIGPGNTPAIDAEVTLPSLAYGDYAAEGVRAQIRSDAFDMTALTGDANIVLTADAAGSANETVAALLAGAIRAEADVVVGVGRVDVTRLDARTGTVGASGTATYTRQDGAFSAELASEILSTALPAAARPVLDRTVDISARIARSGDGALSVDGFEARSGPLSADGTFSLDGETIGASLTGEIADLSRLSPQAAGGAAFSLSASGPLSAPEFSVSATSDEMIVAGHAIRALSLEAGGVGDMAAPSGQFRLSGDVGGEPLAGSATLQLKGGERVIDDLAISLGDNRITGALTLDDALVPVGDVNFDLPDIGPLAALVLADVEGAVRGTARFESGPQPAVNVDASVNGFAMGENRAEGLTINARIADYLAQPAITGRIEGARIEAGGADIRGVGIDLSQQDGWTVFDGALTANGMPASARGRVQAAGERITVELAAAQTTAQGIEARLARPTTVLVEGGTVRLDGLTIAAAGGTAEASGQASAEALDLTVRLASLPARIANSFSPGLDAAGTLSGQARITGAPTNPNVSYDATLADAAIAQTRSAGFGAMRIVSSGTYSGGALQFRANVGEGSGLGLDGGGRVNVEARTLDVSFSGRVPFGFLTRQLAAQGLALNGAADVTISATGSMFSPQLGGSVRSSGARFIHAPSGIAINELQADVTLGGGVARINTLRGTLSTGGTISGSGTVGIDAAAGFPADLDISVADGRYTDGRIVTANFDGTITIDGALTGSPVLAGTVNLGRTVITVPERLPGGLAGLNVQHRNAPADVVRQQEALRPASGGGGGGGGLTLDLQVNAPQQIFVRGRGIDAELGGNIRLTGALAAPQAVGLFTMRRGRLEILTKRLTFTRGTLGFSGSLVPYLDLAATSNAGDADVTVLVTGPANNPAFAFESSPALPEDEILARLVFGRAMDGLSALQIAQLASAAASLAGVGGNTSLLETLRSKTGLDDIDVRTDEKTGDTSVAVGKYLNDRTYLSIERGSQPGSGRATIDLEIGRGVKLRGQAGDDGETRGGIFYEREY